MPQQEIIMENPNLSYEIRPVATIKYPPTPPKIQQMDIIPSSSPHFNDLTREIVTAPQIPRVTQPGSQIVQSTTTTRGCIPAIGATQAFSHTHAVVCNSQVCTEQVTTNARRHFLRDPVNIQTNVSNAQHSPQNTFPTQQEE